MSLEELIQRNQHGKVIPKKIPLSQEVKRSIYLLIFTLLTLIVLLSIVFLLNTSQSTQKGYILEKEQKDKESYELEQRELTNKIIDAQSSKNITGSNIIKNMQPPSSQVYIDNNRQQ